MEKETHFEHVQPDGTTRMRFSAGRGQVSLAGIKFFATTDCDIALKVTIGDVTEVISGCNLSALVRHLEESGALGHVDTWDIEPAVESLIRLGLARRHPLDKRKGPYSTLKAADGLTSEIADKLVTAYESAEAYCPHETFDHDDLLTMAGLLEDFSRSSSSDVQRLQAKNLAEKIRKSMTMLEDEE